TASLTVYRAFPVSISADGTTVEVMMARGTVNDALEKAGLTLADDDLINVSPYEKVVSGIEISINRVTYETV
ncbi:phosphatase, partial [Klebsiella oxytoca]